MRVFDVTADQIDSGMRSKAKMINYGIVYGLSAYGMADRLDIPQAEADEFIKRYLAGFPAVERFIEETIEQGTEHGYVSTLFGRRRQVPELRARRWEMRKQGERFAVNMVIQGTAADIMKVAMVRADAALTREGLADQAGAADPRRAAVRGPGSMRPSRCARSRSVRWRRPTRWIRRWPSRPASATTGCRPSERRAPAQRPATRGIRPAGSGRLNAVPLDALAAESRRSACQVRSSSTPSADDSQLQAVRKLDRGVDDRGIGALVAHVATRTSGRS